MSVCPPPWEGLTTEGISRRLAALHFSLSSSGIKRCFSQDAVFSTGNASIDRLLPDGGVAFGTVLEIFGPPASGKSHLVRQLVASFAVRGGMEWTMRKNDVGTFQQHGVEEEVTEAHEDEEKPCDWCVFFLLSDPSSLSACHLRRMIREALASESSRYVQSGDHLEQLEEELLQKVKVLFFNFPNELLAFFRFLYCVEYSRESHHERRRCILVVVDSVARLWEHPACSTEGHARHWMAAELVREVRNAIIIGNGWRSVPDESSSCCQPTHRVPPSSQEPHAGGSIAVVFVNGCTNVYFQGATVRPLGLPVWHAAAADLQLLVEPFFAADKFLLPEGEASDVEKQENFRGRRWMMRVRLVKGGGAAAGELVVA